MIAENLSKIKQSLPDQVCLVAVSKTKPTPDLMIAYNAGQRHYGENKVQEMSEKHAEMPNDVCWHFIGHLQTNKVKSLFPVSYTTFTKSLISSKVVAPVEIINGLPVAATRRINGKSVFSNEAIL